MNDPTGFSSPLGQIIVGLALFGLVARAVALVLDQPPEVGRPPGPMSYGATSGTSPVQPSAESTSVRV